MLTELVHENKLAGIFLKAYPGSSVQPFIEFYQETKEEFSQLQVRYLPNVAFTIRFNLGGGFNLKSDKDSYFFDDHMLISNNQTWIGDGHVFSIKFKFGLLPYLMQVSHKGFLEKPVPARDVLSAEYIESMERASSFEERVALSENYFFRLYDKNRKEVAKYRIVEEMLNYFNETTFSNSKVEARLKSSFVSPKSLQRYFMKNFGLTPKAVYCIIRMRKALDTYFNNSAAFRVYDFDYYDHSHFYREIKKVVGINLPQLKNGNGFKDVA